MTTGDTMRNQTPEQKYKISLRVNRNLLEEIRAAASRQDRTINSYLAHLLRLELDKDKHAKKR